MKSVFRTKLRAVAFERVDDVVGERGHLRQHDVLGVVRAACHLPVRHHDRPLDVSRPEPFACEQVERQRLERVGPGLGEDLEEGSDRPDLLVGGLELDAARHEPVHDLARLGVDSQGPVRADLPEVERVVGVDLHGEVVERLGGASEARDCQGRQDA